MARLPDRWREEQEHAEGKLRARAPHTWRTRPGPFAGVWCDVLGWLQEDPDASAVALLGRLQEADRIDSAGCTCVRCSGGCSSGEASWPTSWSTPRPEETYTELDGLPELVLIGVVLKFR